MGNSSTTNNDLNNSTIKIRDDTNRKEKIKHTKGSCILIRDKYGAIETCEPMRVLTPNGESKMVAIDANGKTFVFPGDTLVEIGDACLCHQIDVRWSLSHK